MQTYTVGQRVAVLSMCRPDGTIVRERAWYPATVTRVDNEGHVQVVRDDRGESVGWFDGEFICPLMFAPAGLERLVRIYIGLGPNAQRLLEFTAERLEVGKAHGDFADPRDYDRETAEEEFDGAMYRAAKLLGFGTSKAGS